MKRDHTFYESISSPLFEDCELDSVYIGGKIVYGTTSDYEFL
jgi:hypothetical protein